MTASSFKTAFEFVERPDNDGQAFHITRGDVGGATAYSVIWPTYKTYCRVVGKPALFSAFRAFKVEDASPVLKLLFWDALSCDALPAGVDMECFDMEVGSGLVPTTRILQEAINKVGASKLVVDGHIGALTIGAAHACDAADLIDAMGVIETAFYHSLPSDVEFDDGWERRATQRHAIAKTLATDALITVAEAQGDLSALGQFGTLAAEPPPPSPPLPSSEQPGSGVVISPANFGN